jgi:DNA-binding NarL/FixJ family response regulator
VVYRIDVEGSMLALLTFSTGEGRPALDLTSGERQVLRGVLAGKSNGEIANERGTSVRTVANQIARIFEKTGVSSRAQLAARWREAR